MRQSRTVASTVVTDTEGLRFRRARVRAVTWCPLEASAVQVVAISVRAKRDGGAREPSSLSRRPSIVRAMALVFGPHSHQASRSFGISTAIDGPIFGFIFTAARVVNRESRFSLRITTGSGRGIDPP